MHVYYRMEQFVVTIECVPISYQREGLKCIRATMELVLVLELVVPGTGTSTGTVTISTKTDQTINKLVKPTPLIVTISGYTRIQ